MGNQRRGAGKEGNGQSGGGRISDTTGGGSFSGNVYLPEQAASGPEPKHGARSGGYDKSRTDENTFGEAGKQRLRLPLQHP